MYTPKEVCDRLGTPGPTLRRWRAAFRDQLSASVDDPEAPRYSDDDVQFLSNLQRLLQSGRTTKQIREELERGTAIIDVVVHDIAPRGRGAPRPGAMSGAVSERQMSGPGDPIAALGIDAAEAAMMLATMVRAAPTWSQAASAMEEVAAALREQTDVNRELLEELRASRERAASVPTLRRRLADLVKRAKIG